MRRAAAIALLLIAAAAAVPLALSQEAPQQEEPQQEEPQQEEPAAAEPTGDAASFDPDDPEPDDPEPGDPEPGDLPPGDPAIAQRAAELDELRREIDRLQGRLDELRERESGLAGELERTEVELTLQERRSAEAAAALALAERQVAVAAGEAQRLEIELAAAQEALSRRLAGLYRLGSQGYLRLLLATDPGEDAIAAVRMTRYLARRDRQAIDGFRDTRQALDRVRGELVERRDEVASWADLQQQRQSELALLRRRQSRLLAQAEEERIELASQALELADTERKLSGFLDRLYGRGPAPLSGTPMVDFRGVLDWPVEGEVTVGFGPRRDPRYRTEVPHNGIEIATAGGASVRAVYPGEVLFAAPFQGYGPTVVVHHAGRAFTLYAGLAELGVSQDDVLSLGQTVGTASDRLYFEIRVENHPENPLDWLR